MFSPGKMILFICCALLGAMLYRSFTGSYYSVLPTTVLAVSNANCLEDEPNVVSLKRQPGVLGLSIVPPSENLDSCSGFDVSLWQIYGGQSSWINPGGFAYPDTRISVGSGGRYNFAMFTTVEEWQYLLQDGPGIWIREVRSAFQRFIFGNFPSLGASHKAQGEFSSAGYDELYPCQGNQTFLEPGTTNSEGNGKDREDGDRVIVTARKREPSVEDVERELPGELADLIELSNTMPAVSIYDEQYYVSHISSTCVKSSNGMLDMQILVDSSRLSAVEMKLPLIIASDLQNDENSVANIRMKTYGMWGPLSINPPAHMPIEDAFSETFGDPWEYRFHLIGGLKQDDIGPLEVKRLIIGVLLSLCIGGIFSLRARS